ncbi:MAG: 4-phosphopantetheinyl transferase [Alphaproteobacteria bacterium]|nr:4-phosphopantetheinyl transferase [Alphaproteobacteria bacterium]
MRATVDAHYMDLDDVGLDVGRFRDVLSAQERERAARFRFERDRRRYILRHGKLRELLSDYLNCAPSRLRFTYNPFGKPSVAGGDLRFNVSHSHGTALFVFARGVEVGCDIERRDPRFVCDQIPERFFSALEVQTLRSLPASSQTQAFFNCWTRKEAYIKARGYGLSLPLDSFDVSLAPDEPVLLLRGCDGWSVQPCEPAPDYQAAIVAEGADWQLNFPLLSVEAPTAVPIQNIEFHAAAAH